MPANKLSQHDELHSLHSFGTSIVDFGRGWAKRGLAWKGLATPQEVYSWQHLYFMLENRFPGRFGLHIRKRADDLYPAGEYIHGYDLHFYRIDRLTRK